MNIGELKIPKKTSQTIMPIMVKVQIIVITFAPVDGFTLNVISYHPNPRVCLALANLLGVFDLSSTTLYTAAAKLFSPTPHCKRRNKRSRHFVRQPNSDLPK